MLNIKNRYDIIINGGGIVGFTLLNSILRSQHLNKAKVLLIEQAQKPGSLRQTPRQYDESTSSEWNQPNSEIHNEKKFSNRVSSITRASRRALENLGAWDGVKQYAKDVNQIKVWNYDYSHKIIFRQSNPTEYTNIDGKDVMFTVVENNRLSSSILDNIYKHSLSKDAIAWGYSLANLQQKDGLVEAVIKNQESGDEIVTSAPLILGCDGFKSKVRDFMKLRYIERDLNKTALVGTVMMSKSHQLGDNSIAYQRFSAEKDTVAALLPLDSEYSSFVISAPSDYSKFLADCDGDTFISELNQLLSRKESHLMFKSANNLAGVLESSLSNLIRNYRPSLRSNEKTLDLSSNAEVRDEFDHPPSLLKVIEDSRAIFPLLFGTTTPKMIASLKENDQPQVALLGDSSHRIHPLAGQGLNLGIQDAVELVRQLEYVAKHGEKLFDDDDHYAIARALKRYERNRQAYITPMSAAILSMPYLFKFIPSKFLTGVNKCDPIKSMSVKFANGC